MPPHRNEIDALYSLHNDASYPPSLQVDLDSAPGSAPAPTPPEEPTSPGDPYGGVAAEVPGLVEAEEFDLGGEGVGYSDTTAVNIEGVGGNRG